MAQRVVLIDDFDESEATKTVEFSYKGRQYALDLNDEHAAEFDDLLTRYVQAARDITQPASHATAGRRQRQSGRSAGGRSAEEVAAIREWARANGLEVADRGRLPKELLERYEDAQGKGQAAPSAAFSG